jgi:hypothetical protein
MEEINEKIKEYIQLCTEANYPIRDIAKQYKTSVSTVYNAMVAAGFKEFRPRHSRASHTRMSMEQQAIAHLICYTFGEILYDRLPRIFHSDHPNRKIERRTTFRRPIGRT